MFLSSDVQALDSVSYREAGETHLPKIHYYCVGSNEKNNGNLLIFQEERDPEKEDELELKRSLLYRDSAYDSDPEYRYGLASVCEDLFHSRHLTSEPSLQPSSIFSLLKLFNKNTYKG